MLTKAYTRTYWASFSWMPKPGSSSHLSAGNWTVIQPSTSIQRVYYTAVERSKLPSQGLVCWLLVKEAKMKGCIQYDSNSKTSWEKSNWRPGKKDWWLPRVERQSKDFFGQWKQWYYNSESIGSIECEKFPANTDTYHKPLATQIH